MTPEERRARAFRVEAMMRDGEVGAALDDVKADLTRELLACNDAQGRESIWYHIRALDSLRNKLGSLMSGASDGTTAAIRRVR